MGLEVIAQAPELQPTKCQYKYPPIAPTLIPIIISRFRLRNCFIIFVLESDDKHLIVNNSNSGNKVLFF